MQQGKHCIFIFYTFHASNKYSSVKFIITKHVLSHFFYTQIFISQINGLYNMSNTFIF